MERKKKNSEKKTENIRKKKKEELTEKFRTKSIDQYFVRYPALENNLKGSSFETSFLTVSNLDQNHKSVSPGKEMKSNELVGRLDFTGLRSKQKNAF